jgi:thiamine transport system permease protein
LSTPALLLLTFLFFVPLLIILSKAFVDENSHITLSNLTHLFQDTQVLRVISFTLFQAAISTLGALVIGLPGAYILSHYKFRGKKIIRAISAIPFVLPSILIVLGFVIFFGNKGILNTLVMKAFSLEKPPFKILYTFNAIILAHSFYNFPIILSIVSTFWQNLPKKMNQAAITLGAKRFTVFRTITLPRLIPAIISASTLVFLFCFSSFAILLVLGGGPQFTTIEVDIYQKARLIGDVQGASALAIVSIVIALLLVAIYSYTQQKMSNAEELESSSSGDNSFKSITSWWWKIVVGIYTLITSIFVLGPLLSIVYRSFFSSASRTGEMVFSFQNYKKLFHSISSLPSQTFQSLVNSLLIATCSSLIAIIFGTMLSSRLVTSTKRQQFSLELFAMLPMAVSSVILGLGYYIISLFTSRIGIDKMVLVILAHVVITSPFVLRTLLPSYRRIPFSYRQASLTLGATVGKTFFKIELPLLKGAIATSAAFAFAISMGELNATLALADSTILTIPLILYRLIGSYNFASSCALGTILMLICLVIFSLIEYIKKDEV